MSAIYFHIPFCKQACHYCNFHFSTSLKYKAEMLEALATEISLRTAELPTEPLKSIYFGGGTPSMLSPTEVEVLLNSVNAHFSLDPNVEITLEMNPDDFAPNYLKEIKLAGINRLSLGVQSFFDEELQLMNRAHTAQDAYLIMEDVSRNFENYSIDLIYGMPSSSEEIWKKNIEIALGFSPPHISSYVLTIEPKTVLENQVIKGDVELLDEEIVLAQFNVLVEQLTEKGYEHYELSSFGKTGFHSVNNTAYWQGKPYLGIGPSAHSFYNNQRSWNVSNNKKYLDGMGQGNLSIEREILTLIDQYNEFIMIGLRTSKGVSISTIHTRFGDRFAALFEQHIEKHLSHQNLFWDGDTVKVTQKARFLVDGIASDLFLLNL
ncbi:radical SAM family heme chaperone HemW [Flavobacteriaceae bacterium]|jgi:oxygen-independent coproporphyrinogen-3 oxidase|nr:radical SAM family heme chaperone HemW [Flavobacteriaceae bacterium]MDA9330476.1 radical SAM family heme chaperone HemW [Flavobacteriaceae bacterium]MDA9984367.1 radical SAM family heme chaperone HemW [Flavobacteriaceae bacterium]